MEERQRVSQRRRIALLRGAAMERAVNDVGAVFVQHEQALLNGTLKEDLLELCHPDLGWGVQAAKQLARERIFQNERKARTRDWRLHHSRHSTGGFYWRRS